MDFSFSPEQEDLRREARAFLEANPSPSMEQLAELGWVGILQSDDFSFLDAAVIFEELGRVLYDGPYVLNEVAAQPGDDVWSIEIDGFVPHLQKVTRVLTADMQSTGASGEASAAPRSPRRSLASVRYHRRTRSQGRCADWHPGRGPGAIPRCRAAP